MGRVGQAIEGALVADSVKIKATQQMEPGFVRIERDTPFVMPDGRVIIVRAGTLLPVPRPVGPPSITVVEN